MREIPLSNGGIALVDDEDYERIARHVWRNTSRYASRHERDGNGKRLIIYMHREVIGAHDGEQVDHINLDRYDNRRANLRVCSHWQNMGSAVRCTGQSGYVGVSRRRAPRRLSNAWRATIVVRGRKYFLGNHACAELAALAYDDAARDLRGEFTRLNFPREGEQSALVGSGGAA